MKSFLTAFGIFSAVAAKILGIYLVCVVSPYETGPESWKSLAAGLGAWAWANAVLDSNC